jgi:hypothetical protein
VNGCFSGNLFRCGFLISPSRDLLRPASEQHAMKESVQEKLRVLVKRLLRKYKYPPDEPTTGEHTISVNKVLDQAGLLADFWSSDTGERRT